MLHAPERCRALTDVEFAVPSSAFEKPCAADVGATDCTLRPEGHRGVVPTEDRLMLKARQIFALVEQRDRHFQHALMADSAMGVMLSLFLAEFSTGSNAEAEPAQAVARQGREEQAVIDALLEAGLIEVSADDVQKHLALTPLGAGRMRSFISAYPDSL